MTATFRRVCLPLALGLLASFPACQRVPTAGPPPSPAANPNTRIPLRDRIMGAQQKCMGTVCEITVWHHDQGLVDRALVRGFEAVARIEYLTTSWTETSDVARINAAAGTAAVPVAPDTLTIVKKALWAAELSHGAFDITIGVFKGLWKFDEDNDGSLPSAREVKKRLALVNYHDVVADDPPGTVRLRHPGQRLNLEGLAKGYAVDAAVRALHAEGLRDFIVHAGGDLFAAGRHGDRQWRVGIQDPRAPHGKLIFELSLSDRAFNTSGDYERFVIKNGVRYHHILDARTGFPARGARSVTLLANDAFTADTLDTAIFAVGPEEGIKIVESLPDVEAVIVTGDNRVLVSSGLRGKLVKLGDPTPGI